MHAFSLTECNRIEIIVKIRAFMCLILALSIGLFQVRISPITNELESILVFIRSFFSIRLHYLVACKHSYFDSTGFDCIEKRV